MSKFALPFAIPREWSPETAQAIEDNLQRIYGSSARFGTPGGSTIVNGLDLIVPVAGDMIVCLVGGTFVALPLVTTAQRVLTNNGSTPTWALLNLATGVTGLLALANLGVDGNAHHLLHSDRSEGAVALASDVSGVLPLANFFNATATQRLLGRNSAGTGVYEEVTLTQLLDWIGSAAQGDILIRSGSSWARLGAGATAGMLLQTGGASADPSWVTPGASSGVIDFVTQAMIMVHGRPSTLSLFGLGGATQSTAGTIGTTAVLTSAGAFVNFIQTGTSLDLRAGFTMSRFDFFEADADPVFEFVFRAPATITTLRFWVGLCDSDLSVDADDMGGTKKYMAIRFSNNGGSPTDTGFVGICRDGTTQAAKTANLSTCVASTVYKLKIRKSGSTVFFSSNGGAEQSIASNLPAAATALGFAAYAYNATAGATHSWDFGRLRVYYGS